MLPELVSESLCIVFVDLGPNIDQDHQVNCPEPGLLLVTATEVS
jgi:hypothetical protein